MPAQAASQTPAWIAAGAALLAVLIGVLNVLLSSRFSERKDFRQWQRDVLLRAVVEILESSQDRLDANLEAWFQKKPLDREAAGVPRDKLIHLGFQLNVVAPRELIEAESKFFVALDGLTEAVRDSRDITIFNQKSILVRDCRTAFMETARSSLAVK